ncbi:MULTISPECIES: hypothetical protein [Bacillaceae]|uniref:DUF302 domain-containing protein n=1 Tax=Peribacillus huizhouensis TaxID=1501239 RepID=A0ABR6CV74_9BACI|nr:MULTISPECIES: hypothetical protein [Bacillaceae]MBA9028573.1 hypothetical protein [Peribacillus huizhouensis]
MKYQHKDFNVELKEEIKNTESTLKDHIKRLLKENKSVFAKKNLDFDVGFDKEGNDPFKPGYSSSVSIGIADKSGELIDLHIIKIWVCERSLLGMPISKNIPGSKIIGELLDESVEEVKEELKEYIKEVLNDVI